MSLSPEHGLTRHAAVDISGEQELQTDIMRFLAILSLCLMAVFALVQSLPDAPAQASPPAPPKTRDTQLRQTLALQGVIDQLNQQRQALSDDLQRMHRQRMAADHQLSQAHSTLQTTQAQLHLSQQRLTRLRQELRNRSQALGRIERRNANETRALNTLEMRVSKLRRQLADEPMAITPTPVTAPATPARRNSPPAKPKPAALAQPATAQTTGFSLRFASESALRSLIARHKIHLYADVNQRFWRLALTPGKQEFLIAKAPKAYYEMTRGTVPASFRGALARRLDTPASHSAVWGVTLPAEIESRVQALMRERRGGALVIGENGQVAVTQEPRS